MWVIKLIYTKLIIGRGFGFTEKETIAPTSMNCLMLYTHALLNDKPLNWKNETKLMYFYGSVIRVISNAKFQQLSRLHLRLCYVDKILETRQLTKIILK